MSQSGRPVSPGVRLVAAVAASRSSRVLQLAWWVSVGVLSALAYTASITQAGATAPVGGALFIAGLCVVAAVARNASAEAQRDGSVRRGSLLRAAGFGVTVHGGLLAAVSVAAEVGVLVVLWVLAGAALVVLTRPTTLVAIGADRAVEGAGPADPPPRPHQLSTPEILAALQVSAAQVRESRDPRVTADLAERRGQLITELLERNPAAVQLLLDGEPARRADEGPDGSAAD